ncbi:hypothetical protein ROTAS13_01333 [Roseomonas sp. TAS13]|nr:hypothetical protein ROTAS13_01333 [Roseomonas sp. TAS13]
MVRSRMSSQRRSRYSPSRRISGFGRWAPAVRTMMLMPLGRLISSTASRRRLRSATWVILRETPPPRGEFGIRTEKRPASEM